jgi:hypothetical protein
MLPNTGAVQLSPTIREALAYLLVTAGLVTVILCGILVWAAVSGPLGLVAGVLSAAFAAQVLRRPLGSVLGGLIAGL